MKNFFEHTFSVDSNIKDVKVTHIVDPYDRSKDIVCFTPSKITIPWRPMSKRCSLNKLMFEKDGYKTKIVELKPSRKLFIKLMIIGVILGYIGSYLHFKGVPFVLILFVYILLICNISLGSKDIFVTLDKK